MNEALTVVVVEDEPDIGDLLALYFRQEGWDVFTARDGDSALNTIRARQPDFVVLDIGLPGDLDGLDVCRQLRATSNVPVLFLTARDSEVDRVLGLEMGADDYVVKPFSPREIVARVKAILRRGGALSATNGTNGNSGGGKSQFGDITIDMDRRQVTVGNEEVPLTTQEWSLLDYLISNTGLALTRQQILDGGWGPEWIGDPRTVDVHIRGLRKKLGSHLPIATVRGVGYRLD